MSGEAQSVGAIIPALVETMVTNGGELERWPVVRSGPRPRLSKLVRRLVFLRDGGGCQMCSTRRGPWETDHVVPWSAGGEDETYNLRLLCQDCNQKRSNYRTTPEYELASCTPCCDLCIIRGHINGMSRCRWGKTCPACGTNPDVGEFEAYCGCCDQIAIVRDPRRIL